MSIIVTEGNDPITALDLPEDIAAALPTAVSLPTMSFIVDLGAFAVKISLPPSARAVTRFFQRVRPLREDDVDEVLFEVVLVGMGEPDLHSSDVLHKLFDDSYRAIRLKRGYYVTEHFGRPSGMIVRGRRYFFFTEEFDKLVWGYLVKTLLSRFAAERGCLHVKASAFVSGKAGALVMGRGGGGKTVLCGAMCDSGSAWVTNTHALLNGTECVGVPSRLKVRGRPSTAGPHAAAISAMLPGETLVDPVELGWSVQPSCALSALVIVDYACGQQRITEVPGTFAFAIAEQFALAINVYGQKEDYWDYFVPGAQAVAERLDFERDKLRRLTESVRCLHVSIDMLHPAAPRLLAERLAA